jgi:hypothetical protein
MNYPVLSVYKPNWYELCLRVERQVLNKMV